jgi:predicted negative regulator of RcsB-dependent stress response
MVPPVSDEKSGQDELDEKDPPEKKGESKDPTATGVTASEDAHDEGGEDDEVDAANPAEIARRVAALGADDATEALAREEERKLAERRASKKKGKKKTGLEAAASKKLSKIGTRAEPKRTVAVAADADPLIERTAKLSDWAKKNQKTVQIFGGILCVALLAVAGFLYFDHKRETEASMGLAKAVEAQGAKIGEPPKKDDDDAPKELYYKTYDDRRAAALKQYREVQSKFPNTGAAIMARLAEGSLLLDKRESDNAIAAFNDVKGSALAAADIEVKGRALEGIGFAHELKAQANPAEKDKELEAALVSFKELENVADVKGFKEMAMYHQARVLQAKGDKDKAKEVLLSLKERLNKTEDILAPGLPTPPSYPYLKEVAMDRLHEIDPASQPKPSKGGGMNIPGAGSPNLSPEQLKKLMEQMQKGGH